MNINRLSTNHGEIKGALKNTLSDYRAADNRPGDLDPRDNFVSFSDGATSVRVALSGRSFVERTEDQAGNVTLVSAELPGFLSGNPCAAESVSRNGASYSGTELQWEQNGSLAPGWSFDYYTKNALPADEARTRFTRLESQFRVTG